MSLKTRVGLLAGATALTLTGVSFAAPAKEGTNTTDDQAQRIAALEAKIADMEAANNQNWLTEQRASEIKGLVQDVLADADTRASLLQSGATSGYDNGFILSDPSGNWLLRTNFLMQQRFIWNRQDPSGDAGTSFDDNRYGFENTRSKFILSGHVVNPNWFYLVDINVGNNGSERVGTGDAYLGYDYGNGFKIRMGAMKIPFMREELVDAQYQLAVERSIVNYDFTTGYADGIALDWWGDMIHVTGMFSDGFSSGETVWSTGPSTHAEYAFSGRAEVKLSGNWDQFKDFTSQQGGETGVLLGGAVHWERGEFGTPSNETEFLFLTGDVSVELGGVNLYGAIVWADVDPNISGVDSRNPFGFIVQGGFYVAPEWEIFGRFEWEDYDAAGVDDLTVITAGVNKYFAGHNAKWTTDFGYGFNSVLGPANITGWRNDSVDDDGQIVVRTQWQILF
jgi:hypothetical protein